MMSYNGRWIDSFDAEIINEPKLRNINGKIVLKTPTMDYIFTREQWEEFKEKVNKV